MLQVQSQVEVIFQLILHIYTLPNATCDFNLESFFLQNRIVRWSLIDSYGCVMTSNDLQIVIMVYKLDN